MSCCGKGGGRPAGYRVSQGLSTSSSQPKQDAESLMVHFQYTGRTGLTVVGPLTWKHYRFDRPGAVVAVEGQDAAAMVAVPYLRRISAV